MNDDAIKRRLEIRQTLIDHAKEQAKIGRVSVRYVRSLEAKQEKDLAKLVKNTLGT